MIATIGRSPSNPSADGGSTWGTSRIPARIGGCDEARGDVAEGGGAKAGLGRGGGGSHFRMDGSARDGGSGGRGARGYPGEDGSDRAVSRRSKWRAVFDRGRSPQALIGDLREADAELFFASRRAEGFNTVWINLLCNNYTGCRPDGKHMGGGAARSLRSRVLWPPPMRRTLRGSTGSYARGRNMVCGDAGPGRDRGLAQHHGRNNGVDNYRAYGRFLGRRYMDFETSFGCTATTTRIGPDVMTST